MEEAVDPLAEFQTLSLSAVSVSSVNTQNTTITKRVVSFGFHNGRADYVDSADLKVDNGSVEIKYRWDSSAKE